MSRRIGRRAILKSAVAAGAWFAAGALGARHLGGRRSNIIMIVSDALRSDYIGKVAGGVSVMPNINRLAAGGTHFTTCVAPSSWTMFSVPGMLSSQAPLPNTTIIGPETGYLPESGLNVAEVLSEREVLTGAVIKNPWLYEPPEALRGSRKLYSRGFEEYHAAYVSFTDNPLFEAMGGYEKTYAYHRAELATQQAVNFLEKKRLTGDERPFFLYLHYMDTHEPYWPPEEYRRKFVRGEALEGVPDESLTGAIRTIGRQRGSNTLTAAEMPILERSRQMYTAAAAYVDSEVGKFFDYLKGRGLYDDSVIVFTSDHGEEFGEHGWVGHSRALYREVLEVPLVMAGPGIKRGRRVEEVVASVDIVPALLEMGNIEAPEGVFEGEPGAILGRAAKGGIVSATSFPPGAGIPEYVAVSVTTRTGKKYIRTNHLDERGAAARTEEEVYDLRRDGGEKENLAGENADFAAAVGREIDLAIAGRTGKAGMTVEVPEGLEGALETLGYIN